MLNKSDLRLLNLTSDDLILIAKAKEFEITRAFLKAIEEKIKIEKRWIDEKPEISDTIPKDIRYKLGFRAGLKWILQVYEVVKLAIDDNERDFIDIMQKQKELNKNL